MGIQAKRTEHSIKEPRGFHPYFLVISSLVAVSMEDITMATLAQLKFVQQQGYLDAAQETCSPLYSALTAQPKMILVLMIVGTTLQFAPGFFGIAALLGLSALVPALNPFDAIYNIFVAGPKHLAKLRSSMPPRRAAQFMGMTMTLIIGFSMVLHCPIAAWAVQGFLILVLATASFGKFCLPTHIFFTLRGQWRFANQTVPWNPTPWNGKMAGSELKPL
jgi:hypothetical protein